MVWLRVIVNSQSDGSLWFDQAYGMFAIFLVALLEMTKGAFAILRELFLG